MQWVGSRARVWRDLNYDRTHMRSWGGNRARASARRAGGAAPQGVVVVSCYHLVMGARRSKARRPTGAARPDPRADGVGARRHCRVRRRFGPGDGLRRVRRGRLGRRAAGHAQGPPPECSGGRSRRARRAPSSPRNWPRVSPSPAPPNSGSVRHWPTCPPPSRPRRWPMTKPAADRPVAGDRRRLARDMGLVVGGNREDSSAGSPTSRRRLSCGALRLDLLRLALRHAACNSPKRAPPA